MHQFSDELVFDKVEFGRALERILRRVRKAAARGPVVMLRVADGDDGIECQLLHALGAPLTQSAGGAEAIRAVWIRPVAMVASAIPELAKALAKPLEAGTVFDVVMTAGRGIDVSIVDLSDDGPIARAIPRSASTIQIPQLELSQTGP